MSVEIIKEFLVALGFKVDAGDLKRFKGSIESIDKVAAQASKGVVAMAVAVEAAVVRVSKGFEDLYYASQRLHSSVENIRATDYAISQMGGSAQGARAAMEGIASLIRSNPGGERFIRSLGVDTRDANNQLRDTADIMRDLGTRFRQMPYYAAKVRANMLGIDEPTLMAMIRGTGEFSDRYHEMARRVGVDQQAAAEAGHRLMVDLRDMLALLQLTAEKLILLAGPSLQQAIRWFMDLDQATGGLSTQLALLISFLAPLLILFPGLVAVLAGPVGWFIALAAAVTAALMSSKAFREGFAQAIKEGSAEVSPALVEITSAFHDLYVAVKPILDALLHAFQITFGPAVVGLVRNSLHFLAADIRLVADIVNLVANLLSGKWSAAWKSGGAAARDGMAALRALFFGGGPSAAASPTASATPRAAGAPAESSEPGGAPAAGNVGQQIQSFFASKGYTRAQSMGIAAGIWAESHMNANARNPKSGAFGIGQWLGSRRTKIFRRYGYDLERWKQGKGPGPNMQQQLEFMAWELAGGDSGGRDVRAQTTQAGTLNAYVNKYMRPAKGAETEGDLARGSQYLSSQLRQPVLVGPGGTPAAQVTISQKTDIHVSGGADPQHTAGKVAREQERVNGNLVRNTRGAVAG